MKYLCLHFKKKKLSKIRNQLQVNASVIFAHYINYSILSLSTLFILSSTIVSKWLILSGTALFLAEPPRGCVYRRGGLQHCGRRPHLHPAAHPPVFPVAGAPQPVYDCLLHAGWPRPSAATPSRRWDPQVYLYTLTAELQLYRNVDRLYSFISIYAKINYFA